MHWYFLDMAKPFDTVDHKILFNNLYYLWIRGNALNVFKSYLIDMSQRVQGLHYISGYRGVTYGVPQDTVLGPILFLNDIMIIINRGKIIRWADDTLLLLFHKTWWVTFKMNKIKLNNRKNWFDQNLLSIE